MTTNSNFTPNDSHPLVQVRFLDHWGDIAAWVSTDTVKDHLPPVGVAVGWMIPFDEHGIEDHIVLYSKSIGESHLGGVFVFVAAAVVDITLL